VSAPIIQTHDLRKQFGPTLAVAGLSLSVRPGEIFGFLGPNGAGKTTSIKMLLGLIAPTSGSGMLLGAPLGDRAARGGVGFLPEHFRFHDSLTARELLRFHGRLHGLRGLPLDARIQMLLARVDIVDAADRPLKGYSKGMMQRAGLAQALINDPALVFLDEPTSGLDPLGRLLVRDIIAELRSRGTAVFLNSHLLGEVEATCDRVAFVKQGSVVHEMTLAGAPTSLEVELRLSPVDECVIAGLAKFGDARPGPPEGGPHTTRLEGGPHTTRLEGGPGSTRVRLRLTDEQLLPELTRWLVEHKVDVYAINAHRKSLEEWFVEVMGEQRPG
jgi:ABC-2 type transport system ATP-binding protein